MSRQPVMSDFKVEISEDAIVMHFWPTRSVFTLSHRTKCFSPRRHSRLRCRRSPIYGISAGDGGGVTPVGLASLFAYSPA